MSIVVLTSRGQDPAEFENHFSRGINLPRNAEICLCGASLTKADPAAGITIAGENNDSFLVVYGNPTYAGYAPYGSYRVKVKPGIYTPAGLASQIINALAVGNYNKSFFNGNFQDIPVSPLRLGLLCNYDSTSKKMVFTANRHYVATMPLLPEDWLGKKFITSCGQDLGGNPGTIPGTVVENQTFRFAVDERYAGFYPTETANCFLKTDVLWNGSNGAGILSPGSAGPNALFPKAQSPGDIIPNYQYGYRWAVVLNGQEDPNSVLGMRGGIMRGNKVYHESVNTGYDHPNEAANRHDLRLDWAVGGAKFDLWWEITGFADAGGGGRNYTVEIFYMPIPAEQTGNEVWDTTKAVKVGESTWSSTPPPNETFNEIVFRPVDGKLGTDPTAPIAPVAGDATKCCIDFRVNRCPFQDIIPGTAGPNSFLATDNGAAGYVAITDRGQFDLYKGAPLYMGYAHSNNNYPVFPSLDPNNPGAIMMAGIEHETPTTNLQSMSNIDYLNPQNPWIDQTQIAVETNFSFLPVNFAFSPLIEGGSIYRDMVMAASTRFSNIAAAMGFTERKLHGFQSSASATGLTSDYATEDWESVAPLAVIQLPNVAIDGDLGGGNSVWGGSVSANILGVVPTTSSSEAEAIRSSFYEPSNENWIKVKNLGADSLDQIKVKITDTTGRKLTGLTPDSNIWIKVKCGSDGSNLTLEKRGAVNPVSRPPTAIDGIYRNY